MKRWLSLIIVASLVLSPTMIAYAGGNGNSPKEKPVKAEKLSNGQSDYQKAFKQELNTQKKLISKDMAALDDQKLALEAQYQELLASGSTAEAEGLLASINELDTQLKSFQAQMKQIINERYMITKSSYTDTEFAQFETAAALIEKMYSDAEVLGLGSITVKNNIIKMDGPAYIKGGRTIIPVRAITEELGATVAWNPETKSVTVSKDGIEIILTMNSTKVFVNGVERQIDVPAEITNGRTYVPLRFIAETFGLATNWDGENGIIDIEDPTDGTDETDVTDATDGTDTAQETSGAAIDLTVKE